MLKGALGLAAAALVVAQPAAAAGTCWGHDAAAAAKIRDLQSRLMVATLRCRAIGVDVLTSYNDFVRVNRATLQAANGLIRNQFATPRAAEGEAQYDHFATELANAYGDDETSRPLCDATAAAAAEATAANGDIGLLLDIADRLGPPPALPGGECPITFTSL
jgi:hypothetical protein